MKFVLFYHSFTSCWNHGNAHFLRGIARALLRRGHAVVICEPAQGWSRTNAIQDGGAAVLDQCADLVPGVMLHSYDPAALDLDRLLDGADVVIAHEWNDPSLIARLGRKRVEGGRFLLLFHDTHHRAVSSPGEIDRFDLEPFDAVLAFGEVLREMYVHRGWGRRAVTWHEAADTALFRSRDGVEKDADLIWIGNWGDGERDRELDEFLVRPVARLGLRARLHGVRYPRQALERLEAAGISYRGWLPNHCAPAAFARACITVHVPRRPYREALPGIPTIRVFEALACGIPLVSAPWEDAEGLFDAGSFLRVENGQEMTAALHLLRSDPDLAAEMANVGLGCVRSRHTCEHRADELLAQVAVLKGTRHDAAARDFAEMAS